MNSLRLTLRQLLRRPGFSLIVILTLALCIGGNTVIFSAVNALVLRPMPYPDAERLLVLQESYLPSGGGDWYSPSYSNFADWRERNQVFEQMVVYLNWQHRTLLGDDAAERVLVNYVESPYFDMLGVSASIGRVFLPEDDKTPSRVAVLSHQFWQRRYGGSEDVLGSSLRLNGGTYTIVGVLPRDFKDLPIPHGTSHHHEDTAFWLPQSTTPDVYGQDILEARNYRFQGGVLARPKPGITEARVREDMDRIASQLQKEYPDSNRDYGIYIEPLGDFLLGELPDSAKILFAGSLFVLLIGCVNLGNLLMLRARERSREVAVRSALGASKLSLVRQVLLESLVLTLVGGALGLLIANWGSRILATTLQLPSVIQIRLDTGVLSVSLLLMALTAVAISLPVALRLPGSRGSAALQPGGRGGAAGSSRALRPIIIGEIAIAVMLLISAGLLIRSLQRFQATGMNYDSERLLTARSEILAEEIRNGDNETLANTLNAVVDQVTAVPGVDDVVLWSPGIPGINGTFLDIYREGDEPEQRVQCDLHYTMPGALKTLGIPLLQGRDFTTADDLTAPRAGIISDSLAEAVWPEGDALGKRFRGNPQAPWITVVGIYPADRLSYRQAGHANPTLIVSLNQLPDIRFALLARTSVDSATMAPNLRQAIKKVHPEISIYDVATVDKRLYDQEASSRLNATLMGIYAGIALILTILGIYGVLSTAVSRRTQEIGVRLALGAQKGDVLRMILKQTTLLVVIGLGIGIAAAFGMSRFLTSVLYGIGPADTATYVMVTLIFAAVALCAGVLPARRAAKIEPTESLKYE